MSVSNIHVFGIRHHGPGSARSLKSALEGLRPDVILVEGPPDAAEMAALAGHEAMEPPVALLIYVPDDPQRAVYYPFAVYSPEWQALTYGIHQGVPVRFMDLPQTHQMALAAADAETGEAAPRSPEAGLEHESPAEAEGEAPPDGEAAAGDGRPASPEAALPDLRSDPLRWLAEAAGYSDGERWWEHMVEHRRDSTDLFTGILEAMTALREAAEQDRDLLRQSDAEAKREALREAWMRQTIRAAQKEGFERIAVVCGAWHAPALVRMPPAKEDTELLKGLPKAKVETTWVPWTYGRLAFESGYGAGVESPGWYHHLWHWPDRVVIRWMTRVARLFREEDLDASPASVIEAVRLAEALAALRDRPLPGLPELNEAAQTVFCFGGDAPMRLIRDRLIVGERLGKVPPETPMVPLQQDLMRQQKRLRLPPEAAHKDYDLDLRQPFDLERSHVLHRLSLLGIEWGKPIDVSGKGTFHEGWRLQWKPELSIELIQAGGWGNTLYDAGTAFVRDRADHAPGLPSLTGLADHALLADLPDAIGFLMNRLESQAALTSDVSHLMDTLPQMVKMIRYPTVRQTDRGMLEQVVDGLVARVCIGLPGACASLDDDAAEEMFKRIMAVDDAVFRLRNEEYLGEWRAVLSQMTDQRGLHGLIAGRCVWLSFDRGAFDEAETARRMGLALSTATEPPAAAAWVDGLLRGNAELLVHTDALFQVLDGWVSGLDPEVFRALLPLLRRTFSTFEAPARRNIGQKVRSGGARPAGRTPGPLDFDEERAARVLPLVARLLGLNATSEAA